MGVDIAEVDRIQLAIERHGEPFLRRVYTAAEREYCERFRNRYERYAGRFAAKEAAMKALGTGWRRGVKWVDFEVDAKGRELELRYFRDVQGREVDFVIVENRQPIRFIECKWGDENVHPALRYANERFPKADFWQITAAGAKDFQTTDGIRVCPALSLLRQLM